LINFRPAVLSHSPALPHSLDEKTLLAKAYHAKA